MVCSNRNNKITEETSFSIMIFMLDLAIYNIRQSGQILNLAALSFEVLVTVKLI